MGVREKNRKTESDTVIRAGIGYTVGNYLLKGLSFLTIPLFSRLLSTADYGIFNSYLAYQSILFLLIGMALHTSLKNAKYRYGEAFGQYNSCCVLVVVISLGCWILLCNLFYPLYGGLVGFSRMVVNLLLLDSFGTALIQFFNVYVGLDYRYTSFLKLSAFNALANLGISVLLILTVFRENRSVGRIFGNAVPVVIIAITLLWYFWRKNRPALRTEYVKYAITYSFPLIPHGLSQVVLSQFDRIMIRNLIGDSESGIYSFAYTIFSIINVTAASLDNVWGPWFYERMEAGEYEAIRKVSRKYAYGMLLFSVMVMLGAPELVKLLGRREYWDAAYSVIPIVAGGYFMFLYTFPSYVEYYYEKTKYIALGTGLAALVNVILNLVCIRRFGYVAAAYTTLATYLLYFVFHHLIADRMMKERVYEIRRLAGYGILLLLAAAGSLALTRYWLIRWGILLMIGASFVVWLEKEFQIVNKIKNRLAGEHRRT